MFSFCTLLHLLANLGVKNHRQSLRAPPDESRQRAPLAVLDSRSKLKVLLLRQVL